MESDIGIVFVSPIIGLVPSLMSAFDPFKKRGIDVVGVDVFRDQKIKKGFWKVLGLTALPGSENRRIVFANGYDESRLFEAISNKIEDLKSRGKKRVILGGMSGGFIFASRITQVPADDGVAPYASKTRPLIKGLFGISPLIFYPSGVFQKGADIELIPADIPTALVWGDGDVIVPKGTIKYGQRVSREHPNVRCRVIQGLEVGLSEGKVRHQFFGGRDFVGPLPNSFMNTAAEKIAIGEIATIIKAIT